MSATKIGDVSSVDVDGFSFAPGCPVYLVGEGPAEVQAVILVTATEAARVYLAIDAVRREMEAEARA